MAFKKRRTGSPALYEPRNGRTCRLESSGRRTIVADWLEISFAPTGIDMHSPIASSLVFCAFFAASAVAADLEITEKLMLPESHSLNWVRANTQPANAKTWNWKLSDDKWRAAVKAKGEGKSQECSFHLWVPEGIEFVRGVVVATGHGSGEALYRLPEMRAVARELKLALFMFIGDPVQRGFWPKSLLFDHLGEMGAKAGHPETAQAPLFLYGHSNGTGFSAVFAAQEPSRVWAFVSMRPGTTMQVDQPAAARVPGLIIFGEDDPYFARPSKEENMGVVRRMRKDHGALWNIVVEPKTGHGPTPKTWPLVLSFLRNTLARRVAVDNDPRKGPPELSPIDSRAGLLGTNWDATKGGYQNLSTAEYSDFAGDRSTASWLVNADYAADWRQFQKQGELKR
jgi:hypothetical protein